MRFVPEAGEGAEQLVAFAAQMRRLNVAQRRTVNEKKALRQEMIAAGFNTKAMSNAIKRRDERAIGMPWAQLTPIPDDIRDIVLRYESILIHADEAYKNGA